MNIQNICEIENFYNQHGKVFQFSRQFSTHKKIKLMRFPTKQNILKKKNIIIIMLQNYKVCSSNYKFHFIPMLICTFNPFGPLRSLKIVHTKNE